MPRLLLRSMPGTLLESSHRTVVARQMEYGRQRRAPWGISESAFNALDAALDYQYQSFGVPGLGLKRGLGLDLVIAPYATGLAVTVRPRAALKNFAHLAAEGGEGPYGFYEAIDYTPSRVPRGKTCAVVQNYMAHHQGMCSDRPGQLPAGRSDAAPLSQRTDGTGDRVASGRTAAADCADRQGPRS